MSKLKMTPTWRLTKNPASLAAALFAGLVFIRLLYVNDDFSYDYSVYLYYLEKLNEYPTADIISTIFFAFPYITIPNAPLFEVGFVLLAKLSVLAFSAPEAAYASLAGFSVGIRVYAMRKLGANWIWIILTNIYAITLFEANALRLGIATSLIIYGLYCLLLNRPKTAFTILGFSALLHLQVLLFILPFAIAWSLRRYLNKSRMNLLLMVLSLGIGTWLFTALIPQIDNAKVVEYMNRGGSNSAGLTLTSVWALTFAIVTFFSVRRQEVHQESRYVWIAILAATLPSIILLMTLTSIAVIGDRAWQLAFVIVASFISTKWSKTRQQRLPTILLYGLILISIINITIRYPLSNFFDFILPHTPISNF